MTDSMTSPQVPGDEDRPLLAVISSLSRSAREPFYATVSGPYRLWLFLGGAGRSDEPSWELPYLTGHTTVDTLDTDATLAAVRDLHGRQPVAGVVCFDEARILVAARIAEALGLPTSSPDAIQLCRDKHLTRRTLATAGVPQAASVAVRTPAEASRAADDLGYPVVLKPRLMAASFGVRLAETAAALNQAYRDAHGVSLPEVPERFDNDVLVEEYLDGPEISVDSACFDGQIVPLVLARKQSGFPPAFEETGHVVDGTDPLLRDAELLDVLGRAHRAVGFHTGMTHTELRHTASGWRIIEINARLGGDLIPHLGLLANGIDTGLVAAAIATGRRPDVTPTGGRAAAIRFYYPETDITLAGIDIDTALLPAEIERADTLAEPGQQVTLPPRGSAWEARLAEAVAVADTVPACQEALDGAAKAILVEVGDGGGVHRIVP